MASFEAVHEAVEAACGYGQEAVCSLSRKYPIARARQVFVLLCAIAGKTQEEAVEWLERTKTGIEHNFREAKNRFETERDFGEDVRTALKILNNHET